MSTKEDDKEYYEGIAISFEKVKEWLNSIEMNKYIPNFKNNKVWNLEIAEGINKKDLQEMGITKSSIIKTILESIISDKFKEMREEEEEERKEREEERKETKETERRIQKVKDHFGLGKKMKRGKRRRKTRKKSKKRRKKSKKRRKKSKKRRKSRKKK